MDLVNINKILVLYGFAATSVCIWFYYKNKSTNKLNDELFEVNTKLANKLTIKDLEEEKATSKELA